MTKIEYNIRMAWSVFWCRMWGFLQLFGFYPGIGEYKWFDWIVSQTGFTYMLTNNDKFGDKD